MVHGVDLAGPKARGGLFGAALLAVGTGVVGEFLARLEVLYADVWMLRLYAARAGGAPDDSGPAHTGTSHDRHVQPSSCRSSPVTVVTPVTEASFSA